MMNTGYNWIARNALNLFAARDGYDFGFTAYPAAKVGSLTFENVKRADGVIVGIRARGYGEYAPGGNPVVVGPTRPNIGEAQADCADPSRALWLITGYTCG